MEKIATELKKLEDFNGLRRGSNIGLYHLNPPLEKNEYVFSDIEFVVVSATRMYKDIETFIFPADEDGKVIDYHELKGSARGVYDHKYVLNRAGYETVHVWEDWKNRR